MISPRSDNLIIESPGSLYLYALVWALEQHFRSASNLELSASTCNRSKPERMGKPKALLLGKIEQ
jgi:hypothetical protein